MTTTVPVPGDSQPPDPLGALDAALAELARLARHADGPSDMLVQYLAAIAAVSDARDAVYRFETIRLYLAAGGQQ